MNFDLQDRFAWIPIIILRVKVNGIIKQELP